MFVSPAFVSIQLVRNLHKQHVPEVDAVLFFIETLLELKHSMTVTLEDNIVDTVDAATVRLYEVEGVHHTDRHLHSAHSDIVEESIKTL